MSRPLFVTTSDFSKDAQDHVSRVQQRIVLINGQRLADLMLQHGVGVRVEHLAENLQLFVDVIDQPGALDRGFADMARI